MQHDDRIRQRAHEIWEQQGRPEGRQEEHWAQARREIEAGSGPPQAAAELDPSPTINASDDAGTTPAQAAAAVAAVGAPRKAEDKPS